MNIILMILLISLLIFVHELGHFIAAKMCGIRVNKFGFGLPFGPTLFEKQFGETTFCIHACLLGGYVSFPDDEKDSGGLPDDSPELFKNKPVGQRAIVAVAGVTANVLCAIVLVLLTAFIWGKLPSGKYDVTVTKIVAEKGASVYDSGLQTGDRILTINGSEIVHPIQVNLYAQANKSYDSTITTKRADEQTEKLKKLNSVEDENAIIEKGKKINLLPFSEEDAIVLSKTELFGIEATDKKDIINLSEPQKQLRDELVDKKVYVADGKTALKDVAIATSDTMSPLIIEVERNGKKITLKKLYPDKTGIIGIEREYKEIFAETKGFVSGMKNSYNYLYSNTATMIWSLGQIFTGKVPMKDLHGIVAITKVGGDVIQQQGLFKGILLTAIISLNLAIVNLFPIPALDGGHLLFLLVEKIRGKAVDEKTLELLGNTGFYILIVLMILIVFNDIWGLVTNKF